jgi:uncharacterized membrane protein YuzA (DUF378 family)
MFDEKTKRTLDLVAAWLLAIGGINWGLSIWKINVVDMLLGSLGATVLTVVYAVIGIAGLYKLARLLNLM